MQSVVVFLASHTYYRAPGMTATVTAYNDDDLTLHHRFFIQSNSTVYNGCSPYIHDKGGVPGRCPEWLICSYHGCPGLPQFLQNYCSQVVTIVIVQRTREYPENEVWNHNWCPHAVLEAVDLKWWICRILCDHQDFALDDDCWRLVGKKVNKRILQYQMEQVHLAYVLDELSMDFSGCFWRVNVSTLVRTIVEVCKLIIFVH